MLQVQQRLAALTKSRAKLLAHLQVLDRLRGQVRRAVRSAACPGEFQQLPPKPRHLRGGGPGPIGF
jgi:hypothetical protein